MTRWCRIKVLVFEWLCGGGLQFDHLQPEANIQLLQQGRQMLSAVCADLEIAGCEIMLPIDSRLEDSLRTVTAEYRFTVSPSNNLQSTLQDSAAHADLIIVIAPESGSRLLKCLHWLQEFEPQWLNPGRQFTVLASDKNLLQSFLAQNGVSVPSGDSVEDYLASNQGTFRTDSAVLKPADGCGGEGIRLIALPDDVGVLTEKNYGDWRIEEYVSGTPVSVSIVAGIEDRLILPPLRQIFDDRRFGCCVRCVNDLPREFSRRATTLAEKTLDALPETTGCFGIDMVLGVKDVVVEVNPRITLSWCCHREFLEFNLAARMLAAVDGVG